MVSICKKNQNLFFEDPSQFSNSSSGIISEETLRLWKLDPETTLREFFRYVQKTCNETPSYEYQVEFKGVFLEKFKEKDLEHAQIASDDYVILEANIPKNWSFYGDGAPLYGKCENCNRYDELSVLCICKKVNNR